MPDGSTGDDKNETGSENRAWPELDLPMVSQEEPAQAAPPEEDMCACQLATQFCQYPNCENGPGSESGSSTWSHA
jgi:hypothetical protein